MAVTLINAFIVPQKREDESLQNWKLAIAVFVNLLRADDAVIGCNRSPCPAFRSAGWVTVTLAQLRQVSAVIFCLPTGKASGFAAED